MLLSRLLSILNSDWLQHACSVRRVWMTVKYCEKSPMTKNVSLACEGGKHWFTTSISVFQMKDKRPAHKLLYLNVVIVSKQIEACKAHVCLFLSVCMPSRQVNLCRCQLNMYKAKKKNGCVALKVDLYYDGSVRKLFFLNHPEVYNLIALSTFFCLKTFNLKKTMDGFLTIIFHLCPVSQGSTKVLFSWPAVPINQTSW